MEILCETCKTKLKAPDEKLPKDKVVNIPCPKCNSKISVDTRTGPKEPQISIDAEPSSPGLDFTEEAIPEPSSETTPAEPADETKVEFFDEDEKTALICDDNQSNQDTLKSALKELGYRVSTGTDPKDVLEKMRYNHYSVILLNEGFGGGLPSENPVLSHIQPMPIVTRRNIFFALIGPQYRTFDNMTAFSKSANVVINQKDLPHIKGILKRSISDNDRFYKVFKETLKTLGKE